MCVMEALSVCTSARSALAGHSGLPGAIRLTANEMAAVIAGLPFEQKVYVEAKAYDDAEAKRLLWAWLYQKAAGQAAAERWKIDKAKPRIKWLAELIRDDLLQGSPSSASAIARRLGLSRSGFNKGVWRGRYAWLWGIGCDVAAVAGDKLEKQVYG